MYLDFEDYRREYSPVGHAISTREGVLIAFILHLLAVIFVLVAPRFLPDAAAAARARAALLAEQRLAQPPRFVFVQPRVDRRAPRPPVRGDLSDQDRVARTPERPANPTNPLPYSRGNTREQVGMNRQKGEQSAQQEAQASPPQPAPAESQK